MLADLRHAVRALRRAPGYVAAAVCCLALGLGAATTVYSLVNAMLVRPLPFARPQELVALVHESPSQGLVRSEMSLPAALDLRARSRTLAGVAAYHARSVNLTIGDGAEAFDAAIASPGLHALLGVRPVLGRLLRPEDGRPGAPRVLVLGEALWRTRFGARPAVLGTPLRVDGAPATIVGVAPEGVGLTGDREALWLPLVEPRDGGERGDHFLSVVARLRPGATVDGARREVAAIGAQLAAEHPGSDGGWRIDALRLRDHLVPPEIARVFAIMLGAVGFVLLIAASNVANLLLARTAARQRELAVRRALGAGRGRVLRLVVTEGVVVALLGGALAVPLAALALRALVAAVPVDYPSWLAFSVDWRVLTFTFVVAAATGVGFALLPALRATRESNAAALREGTRGATADGRRLRHGLVVGELALSLVLLAGAGLMVRSARELSAVSPGFDPRGTLVGFVSLSGDRYPEPAARARFLATLTARLGALPGVQAATATTFAPLTGANSSSGFRVEGQPFAPGERRSAETRGVLPGYFAAMRIPLRAGRDLTAAESADTAARVLVVNDAMARRWWPAGGAAGALGRRIAFADHADGTPDWWTVVGVVGDVRQRGLGQPPREQVWAPFAALGYPAATLVVRTAGDPAALAPAVRRTLTAADPALPLVELSPMDAVVARSLWRQRLFGTLFATFATVALALAAVGVYGVIAYAVAQRLREMGVRVALGARPRDLYRLVLGGGARLAAAGLAIGLVLALGTTRVLAGVLYGVRPGDPLVLALAATTLAAVALLACWIPARRAAQADPIVSLRAE